MSEKDNIRVAEEYVEALNAHDYARMRTYHGEGFRFQASGIPAPVTRPLTRPTWSRTGPPFPTCISRPRRWSPRAITWCRTG